MALCSCSQVAKSPPLTTLTPEGHGVLRVSAAPDRQQADGRTVACGVGVATPRKYQLPLSLVLPKKSEVANLLVPVCSSASHVAYATVRMEPQFMIVGHSCGVLAALACKGNVTVHQVESEELHKVLVEDGQVLRIG